MTHPDKLTLERLAALDGNTPPGPWTFTPSGGWEDAKLTASDGKDIIYRADNAACGDPECCGENVSWSEVPQEVGDFIVAAKGAAPRLLAALRALAERWDTRAVDEHPVCEGSNCAGCAYSMCAATLRALLTDLDLRAEPGGAR